MRTIAILLAGSALLVGASSYAQTPSERAGDAARSTSDAVRDTTNHETSSNKPAIKSSDETTPGAPVAGANSFTESQARSRIEAHGYSNVSGLAKDDQGIWHATASKGGRQTQVALDYQGNLVEGTAASTGGSTGSSGTSSTTSGSTSGSMNTPSTTTPPPASTTPGAPPTNRPSTSPTTPSGGR
jgi:hypothetical protein